MNPTCPFVKFVDIVLKSESAWSARQISAKHSEAIKILKANAAVAASKINNMKPPASTSTEFDKARSEAPAESSYKTQMGPPQARPESAPLSNFFDKPETKRQLNETTAAKLIVNDKKKKISGSGENKRVEVCSATVAETIGEETQAQTRALPEGFFDDKDDDLRARNYSC